jgi:hypothetical protein
VGYGKQKSLKPFQRFRGICIIGHPKIQTRMPWVGLLIAIGTAFAGRRALGPFAEQSPDHY